MLDSAKARGYREGENPARWRGHLAQILPARARLSRGHHKAMAYEEVPAFVRALREREAMAALALEFTILTAARSGEVFGATWIEVDLGKAIWTIPARRMKAARNIGRPCRRVRSRCFRPEADRQQKAVSRREGREAVRHGDDDADAPDEGRCDRARFPVQLS